MRPGEDELAAFDLAPRGLLFVDASMEADYLRWHALRGIPFARVAMIAALASWMTVCLMGLFIPVTHLVLTYVAILAAMGLIAVAFVVASRRWLRWIALSQVVANTGSGLTVSLVGFVVLDIPEAAMFGVVMTTFFGFTVQPLRVKHAAIAVIGYLTLNQLFTVIWFVDGRIGTFAVAMYSIVHVNVFVTGVLAATAAERVSRQNFRQERVITAQRAALERERERTATAERARELSEALLRMSGAPSSSSPLVDGQRVADRYRVVRAIGRGGMGQVYEVERISDSAPLALKVMTGSTERVALARFAREAQLAAELRHPNVVAALDVGVTEAGALFLVMELVGGKSLAASRSRFGDASWALPILRDTCAALVVMHERGIVHRDLKPANILLADDHAKVADFGLAVLRAHDPRGVAGDDDTAHAAPDLTNPGAVMGTPNYMAPELAAGAEHASPASDMFSFGVVAFELLANQLPHRVPPVTERLENRVATSPTTLSSVRPELPKSLAALVDRCLASAADRPSAADVADELRASPEILR